MLRNEPGLFPFDIGAWFSLSESIDGARAFRKVRETALTFLLFSSIPPEQSWSRVGSAKGCLISPPLACAAEDYPVTYGAIEMLGKGRKETERNGAGGGKGEEMRRL